MTLQDLIKDCNSNHKDELENSILYRFDIR